ncbi:hypothetical protein H0H92_010641 [Tricholoma furcatifolium]|nr:hypothetical protein H0H92_010641 [Tricholoma furcatifolium]
MPSDSSGQNNKGPRVDDASNWEHPLSQLRDQQRLTSSPNLQDPGYIRQKANDKLWVRERLVALLDPNSWVEVGSITGKPVYDEKTGALKSFTPANSVTGFGRIHGRKVFVTADDFSVRGGHADGGIGMKAPYGELIARKSRVPLIRLLDGSSGGGSVATYLTIGATYIPGMAGLGRSMDTMAVVPVVSALLGPVVGLAAAKAVTSHFNVMVKGLSQLFAAGPPVVKQATFEDLSKEALGGWEIHAQNGTVDNVAETEQDAFAQIATFLSYLPSSIFALPPVVESTDSPARREEELVSIIPRRRARPYDVRRLIRLIVDTNGTVDDASSSTFFEIGKSWGRCIVTGFARLAGRPVGVVTSDCLVNGGSAAERMATIRHGASAMSALYNATIPIYTVVTRRAFGVAGGVFADPEDGAGTRVAWPSGDWGSLPLEGGIEAAYKRRLDEAGSPEAREKLMEGLLAEFESVRSPLKTANKFGIEEIIDPRDTRALACDWVVHVYEHTLPQLSVVRQSRFGLDLKPSSGRGYRL